MNKQNLPRLFFNSVNSYIQVIGTGKKYLYNIIDINVVMQSSLTMYILMLMTFLIY